MFMVGDTLWIESWEHIIIPYDFTGTIRWPDNELWWWKNGRFHREDGPAKISQSDLVILDNAKNNEWYYEGISYGYGLDKPKNFPA